MTPQMSSSPSGPGAHPRRIEAALVVREAKDGVVVRNDKAVAGAGVHGAAAPQDAEQRAATEQPPRLPARIAQLRRMRLVCFGLCQSNSACGPLTCRTSLH